jgi:hypothetical protein
VAGTDIANVRMAKTFERGNYPIAHQRIDLRP